MGACVQKAAKSLHVLGHSGLWPLASGYYLFMHKKCAGPVPPNIQ
jgi:hypothetical protein